MPKTRLSLSARRKRRRLGVGLVRYLEDKRYQVKALPLDEKILFLPRPLRKSLWPPLVPEPFNLTHIFKKNENEEKEEDLISCGVPIREPAVGPKKTQIEPFSFELKDKEMLQRKQKKIQEMKLEKKQKEEEEMAKLRLETVHKAQPMPKFKPLPKKCYVKKDF